MTDSARAAGGLVIIDKPAGMTSHDVVAKARRALGTRKVGHAGTLDPMATGVLVLGFGRATRLLGHLMLTEKAYDGTIRLGVSTTTDDAEGEVTASREVSATPDEIRAALATFVGEIEQVPTAVSAIKVDGKRAYARVRDGEDVQLEPRRVTIHELETLDIRGAEVDVRVRCSSGTYIRAIARDLGEKLGAGGHLTALRRTAVGPFTLDEANTGLEDLTTIPIEVAARAAFPAVDVDAEHATRVGFGHSFADVVLPAAGSHALFGPDGSFLALYENRADVARPVAVFV